VTGKTVLPLSVSSWSDEELQAIQEVVKSGQFSMGPRVRAFEAEFAKSQARQFACMVNSGSSANLIMLSAARYNQGASINEGSEVIVPAVSWSTTYYPVNQVGAVLRFVDVDPDTFNLSVAGVEAAISDRTGAVLAVNLLGNPAPLFELKSLCEREEIILFEDNCESLGASIQGKPTGSFGLAASYSFFYSHHISTMEGGMVVSSDLAYDQTCRSLRAHGWTRELPDENSVAPKSGDPWDDLFRFALPGYNVRPLELEAAVGTSQLSKLPDFVSARRENAEAFKEYFGALDTVRIQTEHGSSSWFGFGMCLAERLLGRRREVVTALMEAGIETRPIVAGNFTRNPVMKHLNAILPDRLPNADHIHENGFFIGNHHFDIRKPLAIAAEIIDAL
jgi:CDP-6-deoxy-D-xylo-4-hexulose-3-dehydrase